MIDRPGRLDDLSPQEKRALLAEMLRNEIDTTVVPHPLSYGQQAMWFLYQLAPESSAYNVAFTARIRSEVDVDALRRAIQGLIDRHAPLRSTFSAHDGKPVQLVSHRREATLTEIYAADWDDETLYRRVVDAYRTPFDLERGPMLRACVFTRGADDHVILLAAHHIILDGWAVWVLLDELRVLYAAETTASNAALPPLSAQFSDYVHWQHDMLASPAGERLWSYWRDRLTGELPVLDLQADRPRPPAQTFNGATFEFTLGDNLTEAVKGFAKDERTTVYTVLLAAFQVLLHRYSGQEDIVVGSPMAGRSRPEFAALVGDFINMVAIRANLAGAPSFRDFLAQVRETVLGALEHQDYPFPLLVTRLAAKPDPSRSPIFQAAFDLQRIQRIGELTDLFIPGKHDARVDVGGLILEPYPMPQQEGQLDLIVQIAEAGGALHGALKYNSDLFDAATIERMAGHYRTLIEAIVAAPDRSVASLPLLTNDERARAVTTWNATVEPYPSHVTLHQVVEAQVDRTSSAVAVSAGADSLTYQQLEQSANRLANYLRRRDIGRGAVVGVCVERSPELVMALLGVLKSGAAYLPLDPSYPAERLAFMLADSGAVALLTTADLNSAPSVDGVQVLRLDTLADEIRHEPESRPAPMATLDDLAYMIYTSGSTGKPKGVEVPHRAVVNLLSTMSQRPGLTASDVLVAITTVAFDIAALELFLPLSVGARVVVADRNTTRSGPDLLELLRTSHATVIQATPVTFRLLLQHGLQQESGLRCLCGGEAMPVALASDLLDAGVDLWNMYGPTETTVWSAVHHVENTDATIPIGRPIGNTQIYVLDSAMQPLPPGIVGELYIGGDGVSRGYRHLPELTAERFVPDPFTCRPGARLYRTGDLGRYRADGTIVVLGRTDHQVKVRGFRIELGEIEVVLSDLPQVREAAVLAHADRGSERKLVAYITTQNGSAPSPGELRSFMRSRLPDYMVPAAFVVLDALPLTANGKLDRLALPAPSQLRADLGQTYAAPQTPTEQVLARIWCGALGIDRVGLVDNFFDLGGHSLQLVEALAAIEQQLGVRINPAYAQTQTLGQLAAICDEMIARGEVREQAPAQSPTNKVASAMRRMLGARTRQETR